MRLFIIFCLFFLNAHSNATFFSDVKTAFKKAQQKCFGSSLADLDDPRVVALIITGVITATYGCTLNDAVLYESKNSNPSFTVLNHSTTGQTLIILGLFEIVLSRLCVKLADELYYKAIQNS